MSFTGIWMVMIFLQPLLFVPHQSLIVGTISNNSPGAISCASLIRLSASQCSQRTGLEQHALFRL